MSVVTTEIQALSEAPIPERSSTSTTAMTLCDLYDVCSICDSPVKTSRGLRIQPLTPADMQAVSDMTARCSRDTIYHRFHGFINLPTYLGTLLTSEQQSVLAWWAGCCIGLASLGPGPRGQELAVLVEDSWQRQGVGVAMLEALVDLAKREGFGVLHADVLFENVFILGVLARYGWLQVELEYGDYSVAIHLNDGPGESEASGAQVLSLDAEPSPATTKSGAS